MCPRQSTTSSVWVRRRDNMGNQQSDVKSQK
jgi:hypothetical protein